MLNVMGVKLAKNAGFCMGVRRAMDIVLDIARHMGGAKVYTYGPLIHNPQTMGLLKKRGIVALDDIDDITTGTVIIRAHGISPQERARIAAKGIKIIDATCPKVANVQAIIKKHAKMEYAILIVGDREHPEVKGLVGYAQGKGTAIGSKEDASYLPDLGKVCVVAQTTQNKEEYNEISSAILNRFPDALIFDTICESTESRQTEVKEMAVTMDALVIVGGKNSANTRRLAEISKRQGTPTFHIETVDDLKNSDFSFYDRIGISAGASTPNWIIEKVFENLSAFQRQKRGIWLQRFLNLWAFSVRNGIYFSVGAVSLLCTATLLQGFDLDVVNIIIVAFYVFSMHRLNRTTDRKMREMEDSFSGEMHQKMHQSAYVTVAIFAMATALILAYWKGTFAFLLLFVVSAGGMLYSVKIIPQNRRIERIKDLPGSKNLLTALGLAAVTALIPQLERSLTLSSGMILAFLFNFSLVFVQSTMSDMVHTQSDRLIGRETIPVLIGEEKTRYLLMGISVLIFLVMALAYPLGWAPALSFFLLAAIFYIWICFYLYDKRSGLSGAVLEGLLQTSYIISGLSALFWFLVTAHVHK
jgi:4-hydroxy-3-methylbut-2-enyl diphosphate reductase